MSNSTLPFWLEGDELIGLEDTVCHELRRVIHFESCNMYFAPLALPELLDEEKRLLLPVSLGGKQIAALRLDGVDTGQIKPLLGLLPSILDICLEKIIAELGRDPQTGLESEENFIAALCGKIRAPEEDRGKSAGLIILEIPELSDYGAVSHRTQVIELLPRLAKIIKENVPSDCVVARIDKLTEHISFGLLFAAPGRVFCQRLAHRLILAFKDILLPDLTSGDIKPLQICAGHSLYPHDLSGRELRKTPFIQALLLRSRARIAARAAWRADHLSIPAVAWGWIPMLCCVIEENLGNGFLRLNCGTKAGIREGQRFNVIARGEAWESRNRKAQLEVRRASEDYAIAELIHVCVGRRPPEQGDGVILIREELASPDSLPLASQERFFARFKKEAGHHYALVISHFIPSDDNDAFRDNMSGFLEALPQYLPETAFAGYYGNEGMIVCLPGANGEQAKVCFKRLHLAAGDICLKMASGIFIYPCLNFDRQESERCALKALAYAELLPAPHIGELDAYAIAISADQRFSQGDEAGALEEYRLALLLKPNDASLLNSLGVCLASLNKNGEAKRCFESALKRCLDASLLARINYNLGNIYQKEENFAVAQTYYRSAVQKDSTHLYAWTRLAQMHERRGQIKAARAHYHYASRLARDNPDALNVIQRQLARLERACDDAAKAREILHDSLVRNPGDIASLLLLAQTYVKEDPEMAESLARKCLSLGQIAQNVLSDALTALGREEEAALFRNS